MLYEKVSFNVLYIFVVILGFVEKKNFCSVLNLFINIIVYMNILNIGLIYIYILFYECC